jgi:hypothetical protein
LRQEILANQIGRGISIRRTIRNGCAAEKAIPFIRQIGIANSNLLVADRRWIVEFGTITALSRNHRTRANAAIDPGRQMSVGINGLPEWLTIKERLMNAPIFVASKR